MRAVVRLSYSKDTGLFLDLLEVPVALFGEVYREPVAIPVYICFAFFVEAMDCASESDVVIVTAPEFDHITCFQAQIFVLVNLLVVPFLPPCFVIGVVVSLQVEVVYLCRCLFARFHIVKIKRNTQRFQFWVLSMCVLFRLLGLQEVVVSRCLAADAQEQLVFVARAHRGMFLHVWAEDVADVPALCHVGEAERWAYFPEVFELCEYCWFYLVVSFWFDVHVRSVL